MLVNTCWFWLKFGMRSLERFQSEDVMVSLDTGSEGASVVPWFVVCFFLVESCVWYLIILWHFVWLK